MKKKWWTRINAATAALSQIESSPKLILERIMIGMQTAVENTTMRGTGLGTNGLDMAIFL
jgi:hypothetical protein